MAMKGLQERIAWLLMGSLTMVLVGCGGEDPGAPAPEAAATVAVSADRVDVAGITLPPGFTATVFAERYRSGPAYCRAR